MTCHVEEYEFCAVCHSEDGGHGSETIKFRLESRDFLRDNAKYLMTDKRERVGKRRRWGVRDDCGFPAERLYHLPE